MCSQIFAVFARTAAGAALCGTSWKESGGRLNMPILKRPEFIRLFGGAVLFVVLRPSGSLAQANDPPPSPLAGSEQRIPSYNRYPPAKPLPPILAGDQLSKPPFDHDYQIVVYKMAAAIPDLLVQLPCYCDCDKISGHTSLHSCFEQYHAAECSTCMQECIYAYQQAKLGRSITEIRKDIIEGASDTIDSTQAKL